MKKLRLFTMIFIFSVSNLFAQNPVNKGFFSVNIGPSIPTGNYASKVYNNNAAGYATIGFVRDYSFGYKIHPKLGLTAVFRSQANGYDANSYAQGLENYLQAKYPNSAAKVTMVSNAYTFSGMLAGVYGIFPISEKMSFEPRFLMGLSIPTLPDNTLETYSDGSRITTTFQRSTADFALSYNIGLGTKYEVGKKFYFLMNLDFYAASANFQNVEFINYGYVTREFEIEHFYHFQNFSTFNLNTGFGFRF